MAQGIPWNQMLTKAQAAVEYDVSEATIHRWMKTGRIAYATMPGGQPRFPRKLAHPKISLPAKSIP